MEEKRFDKKTVQEIHPERRFGGVLNYPFATRQRCIIIMTMARGEE
jgi:hypothetical protein